MGPATLFTNGTLVPHAGQLRQLEARQLGCGDAARFMGSVSFAIGDGVQ